MAKLKPARLLADPGQRPDLATDGAADRAPPAEPRHTHVLNTPASTKVSVHVHTQKPAAADGADATLFEPSKGYYGTPNAFVECGHLAAIKGSSAMKVFEFLRYRRSRAYGLAWPSLDEMASKAGVTSTNVSRALKQLQALMLIELEPNPPKEIAEKGCRCWRFPPPEKWAKVPTPRTAKEIANERQPKQVERRRQAKAVAEATEREHCVRTDAAGDLDCVPTDAADERSTASVPHKNCVPSDAALLIRKIEPSNNNTHTREGDAGAIEEDVVVADLLRKEGIGGDAPEALATGLVALAAKPGGRPPLDVVRECLQHADQDAKPETRAGFVRRSLEAFIAGKPWVPPLPKGTTDAAAKAKAELQRAANAKQEQERDAAVIEQANKGRQAVERVGRLTPARFDELAARVLSRPMPPRRFNTLRETLPAAKAKIAGEWVLLIAAELDAEAALTPESS